MEKYDYIVKSSEIRKLVEKRMYQKALQIMDTMDMNRVKDFADLSIYAEIYMQTERYDDAERILLRLREKSTSRRIIYQLIKLSIKRKNVEDAEFYYNEFIEAAPRDADKFILRYRIDKMEGKDYPVLIASLKELKEYDYTEKWAYELAKLYHKAGMVDLCVNECSDIVLWFGEGVVVEKAKMLRDHYLGKQNNATEGATDTSVANELDFLEQEELELQEEDTGRLFLRPEVPTEQPKEQEEPVDEETVEEPVEEPVKETTMDDQFRTQDLSNISQMLENYFEEEKQAMEIEAATTEEEAEAEEEITEGETPEEQEPAAAEEPADSETEEEKPISFSLLSRHESIDDHKELFGRFYSIASIRLQVVNLVDDMLEQQMPYSFCIAGNPKSGKTTLAKDMIRFLYEQRIFPYKKVAKISSERLNDINLEEHYERLTDGYMIVEEAGGLKPENQLQLIRMLRDLRGHMLVILEDTQENLLTLFRNYPMLSNYIPATIRIEAYGKKELYDYAMDFFAERKFELEEDAEIMLGVICEELEEKEMAEQRPGKLLEELTRVIDSLEQRVLNEVANEKSGKDSDDSITSKIIASDFGNE